MLEKNDFGVVHAARNAYDMSTADNKRNDNPVWREGENGLTAAAFTRR
jgi:hypothetical protein